MKVLSLIIATTSLTLAFTSAIAQTLISHSKAEIGGISPGDAPGYPITLSATGAYKLTGNLIVPAGTTGIHITGKYITLDLNGFTVSSSGTCFQGNLNVVTCTQPYQESARGIYVQGYNAVVRNGHVKGFSGDGLAVNRNTTLDQLQVSENAGHGIDTQVTSVYNSVRVSNLHVHENRLNGINMDTAGLVENTRIESNGGSGIWGAGAQVLVVNTLAMKNKIMGFLGVAARSTVAKANGTNRTNVISLGSNLDDDVPY